MKPNKELAILEIAEEMVRHGGYNCFSFRGIAKAVGIKSASVHYHFPTKAELGVALTRYYTEKFLGALRDPKIALEHGEDPIADYVSAFRKALEEDKGMCMCGMLGAQAKNLPDAIVAEIRTFFARNLTWLREAYVLKGFAETLANREALRTMSSLEGAMLMSNVTGDLSVFDLSTEHLLS